PRAAAAAAPTGHAGLAPPVAGAAGLFAGALHHESAPCRRRTVPPRYRLADDLPLSGEAQRVTATPAAVASAPAHQCMTLGREGDALGATTAVQITGAAFLRHRIVMTSIGWQAEQARHQTLPFAPVWADTAAIQRFGQQVRNLMRHGLLQKILSIFAVELGIEPQQDRKSTRLNSSH